MNALAQLGPLLQEPAKIGPAEKDFRGKVLKWIEKGAGLFGEILPRIGVKALKLRNSECLPYFALELLQLLDPTFFTFSFFACLEPDLFHFLQEFGPGDKKPGNLAAPLPGVHRERIDGVPGPPGGSFLQAEEACHQ